MKIIRGAKYGEILGAHIVGAHATEMIHELVVARTNEYTVEEVDLAIHAHPTLSEAIAEAALDSLGQDDPRVTQWQCDRELPRSARPRHDARTRTRWRSSARWRGRGSAARSPRTCCSSSSIRRSSRSGRSSKERHLLASPALLAARGVELFEVERGGDVTFHGPGQLVGYPIIDLKRHKQDLHWYLRQVEEALIRAVAPLGIAGERSAGYTGVWTQGRKLASIGVHARDWVTWHGFALNVTTDLSLFRPHRARAASPAVEMTSVARELARARTTHGALMRDVRARVADAFGEVFSLELAPSGRRADEDRRAPRSELPIPEAARAVRQPFGPIPILRPMADEPRLYRPRRGSSPRATSRRSPPRSTPIRRAPSPSATPPSSSSPARAPARRARSSTASRYLIERGVAPERILLLTFTRRAAGEMLSRAERLVGAAGRARARRHLPLGRPPPAPPVRRRRRPPGRLHHHGPGRRRRT